MTNQTTPVTETVFAHVLSLPPVLCLFKPKAHVCTPRMVEDRLRAYIASSHDVSPAV
jgi:hypothetical protein